MSEEKQVFQPPLNHDISRNSLRLLIDGYVRNLGKEITIQQIIPTTINQLFTMYYAKKTYIIILDETNLKLTLCDTESENIKLTSNDIIQLNEKKEEKEELNVGGTETVGICHKQNINIGNSTYNVIFKVGGKSLSDGWGTNMCGMIIYPTDIEPHNFSAYYYNLPQLPEIPFDGACCYYNNPVYSQKYGLILFGTNSDTARSSLGQIANLKLNLKLDSFESFKDSLKDSLKWNVEKVPNDIALKYTFPPNYCLINQEKELFIINGADERSERIKQVSIYNLETKECKILKKNEQATYLSGITYCERANRIYVGGGDGSKGYTVFYYDLYKQEYKDVHGTNNKHGHPVMWLANNDNILNIASIEKDNLFYEWMDLRAPGEWYDVKWTNNQNITQLASKIWNKDQLECCSVIHSYAH